LTTPVMAPCAAASCAKVVRSTRAPRVTTTARCIPPPGRHS